MTDAGRVADLETKAENDTGSTGIGLLDVVERWKQQFSAGRVGPPPASSASGPARIDNQMVWRASAPLMTDCACGGRFLVARWHPGSSIRGHQSSQRHQDWRKANGFDDAP